MSNSIQSQIVGTIEEFPDILVDGCLCNDNLELMFMSVWGRDTAINSLLGSMTVNTTGTIPLTYHDKNVSFYFDADVLTKKITRGYSDTYFGTLVNLWVFNKQIDIPDFANNLIYLLENRVYTLSNLRDLPEYKKIELWRQVVAITPFPLLDHWQEPIMEIVIEHNMIKPIKPFFGQLTCWRISLDTKLIQNNITQLIQSGLLTI